MHEIKRKLAILLIVAMSINSFGAIVSDNDGSAFVTKAEFDALKESFNKQIDDYNASIDGKIDGAIASYLSGIQISNTESLNTIFDGLSQVPSGGPAFVGSKILCIIGKNNKLWAPRFQADGHWFDGGYKPNYHYDIYAQVFWGHAGSTTLANGRLEGMNGRALLRFHMTPQGGDNRCITAHYTNGDEVDRFSYGLRGTAHYDKNYVFYITATNWRQGCLIWNTTDGSWQPKLTLNPASVTSYVLDGGNDIFTWNIMTRNELPMFMLREVAASGTYLEYTPTNPIIHWAGWPYPDPVVADKNNYSLVLPSAYTHSTYIGSGSAHYDSNVRVGSDYLNYMDGALYFFPNDDGSRIVFKFDEDNFTSNFVSKQVQKKADGSLYNIGELNALPASESEVVISANLWTSHNHIQKDMLNYLNASYSELGSWKFYDSPNDTLLTGSYTSFNLVNMVPINTLSWAPNKTPFGRKLSMTDCPPLVCDVPKDGTLSLLGGMRCTYASTDTGMVTYTDGNGYWKLYFSKAGRTDEVESGNNNWTVNNPISYKYRALGSSTWLGPVTYIPNMVAATYYEYQFDVNKNDDIYMHLIFTTNPSSPNTTGYNAQNGSIVANPTIHAELETSK